ncbi:transposase-like protein [Hirsutella rhossiliensis]|uniref:Transposase-like protein n=1 Tax=Hirsutella rhossiliensis TaxID=111463 RepID=A0A9P8N0N8_9HYPO|nr:transposase-like protein [Hirsutella rhossiliensis]KAH0962592.1 transposase-like protein [Hirsutella rhossiliensis]
MMRSLSLVSLLRRYDIRYDPKSHRLRCQGHIINLAAKAFLFVTDNEKLKDDERDGHNVTLKEIEAWRKRVPLASSTTSWFSSKVVFSVAKSFWPSAIIASLREIMTRGGVRGTPCYERPCILEAQSRIFQQMGGRRLCRRRALSEEWVILEKIKSFLEKLKMTTKALESSFATLDNVLLAMDFVLAQFEAGKEAHIDDPIMAPMYNSGWAKMDKYYCLTDESPAYVAAIVLHPSHKWHYIHENWKKEWADSSKKLMETLWDDYKPVEPPSLSEVPLTTTNEFLNWRNKHLQPALITDEYERYSKELPIPEQNGGGYTVNSRNVC